MPLEDFDLTAAGRVRAQEAFLGSQDVGCAPVQLEQYRAQVEASGGILIIDAPDESPTLVFADRMGETRIGLGVDPQGTPGLTLFERDAPRRAEPTPLPANVPSSDDADSAEPAAAAPHGSLR